MTDSRSKITFRADGVYLVVQVTGLFCTEIFLSREEGFALQCQLCAAMEQVEEPAGAVGRLDKMLAKAQEYMAKIPHSIQVAIEDPNPETWRDREPML